MKRKNLLRFGLLSLFFAFTTLVGAQTVATVSWPWNSSDASDAEALAAQEPEISISANYILTPGEVILGGSLDYYASGIRTWDVWDVTDDNGNTVQQYFTEVTANADISSASDASTITFPIEIAEGYTFTPTNVTLKAERDGHSNGNFNILWVSGDNTTTIAEGIVGNRATSSGEKLDDSWTDVNEDITADAASGSCSLQIVITKMSSGKSVGYADIVITGTLENTATGEEIQLSFSPAQDETVSSVSEIIIMADQAISLADEDNYEEILGNITVQNLLGTVKTNIVDYESLYAEDDEYEEGPTVGLKLILADTLVAKGNYIYDIPEGTFGWSSGGALVDTFNEDITVGFSIDGSLDTTDNDENLTLNPADGETVGTLSQIEVGGKISVNWNVLSNLSVITVTDETGTIVAVCDSIQDVNDAESWDYNDAEIIYLNTEITEAGNYTLSIPAEAFYVGNDQNSLSEAITATYTVTGETFQLTYSPAMGETVDEVSSISITANENVGFLLTDDELSQITVKNSIGTVVATVTDYESIQSDDEDATETLGVKLLLDNNITVAGLYSYTIPAKALTWGNANTGAREGAEYNEATTITFRVSGNLAEDSGITYDPQSGSKVESLSVITITCEDGIAPSYTAGDITVTVDSVAYTGTITAEPIEPEGVYDPYTQFAITLSDPIETEGATVEVTIPENYFIYGESDSNNSEIVLIYTIGVDVLSFSPANGETVDALNSISITANQAVGFLLSDDTLADANITVKNINGNVVATVVDYASLDNQDEVDADETGETELITNGVKLILDKNITAGGLYHYTIPAGILEWGNSREARTRAEGEASYNEETTITFWVSGALEVDGDLTFDPENGSSVGTLNTITVSCEDGVAPSYTAGDITATIDGDEYTGTISCEPVEPEGEYDPYTECIITFSEPINPDEETTVEITIPEGYFIYGENDANSDAITLTYTVQGEFLTFSPYDGETVDAINSISITAKDELGFLLTDETLADANITVKNINGEVVATVVDYESIDNQDEVDAGEADEIITNGVKLILDNTITAAGLYHYLIPENILAWGSSREARTRAEGEQSYNEATTITFRVSGALEVSGDLTFDPEDGSQLDSISSIVVGCVDGIAYNWGSITVTKVNEDGTEEAVDGVVVECEDDYLTDDYDEVALTSTITFTPAITEEGTYHITIAESAFIYGTDYDYNCEETVLTYTVLATGIKGVTWDSANGKEIYYNLNGQRVSTPSHGIYILNGKKVLVK